MPRPVTKHACSDEWKPVTVIEMKKFFGLIFVTGIVRKLKLELYWSMRGIFQTPIFSQTMSRNRFQFIQRYLHFSKNNAAETKRRSFVQNPIRTPTPNPSKRAPKNDPLAGLMEK